MGRVTYTGSFGAELWFSLLPAFACDCCVCLNSTITELSLYCNHDYYIYLRWI